MSGTSGRFIQQATFNPKIKTYLFAMGALSLFITIVGIPLLLIYPLGIGQYFSRRYYESLQCRLTDRHLEFKKGAFFKVEKTIPLENIQDLTFITNPFLNYFGLQMLKIETAGQSNPHGSDMKLIGIEGLVEFKQKVLSQRALISAESQSAETKSIDKDDQMIQLLTEIRELLKKTKN